MKTEFTSSWIYCYKRGDKAVFLNRWDENIREFDTYEEAEKYADENINLIDIKNPKQQTL